MPVTAKFEGDVLVVSPTGTHSVADTRNAIIAALDAPGAPRAAGIVMDVRKSKSAPGRSKLPIRSAVNFIDSIRDRFGSRYAMVVTPTTALRTVRLIVLGLEELNIEVHLAPSIEEAVAWCRAGGTGSPGGDGAAV